jgi:cytochrome c oxidase subunit II
MVVLKMPILARRWRAAVAAVLLSGSVGVAVPANGQARRVIRISAERFVFTPSEIVIERGEEVEFQLTSEDTAHGFRIVGTTTNVTIPKRGRGELPVIFRAAEAGRYTFECSRMCGAGHHFMRGVLIVREPGGASRR